MTNQSRVLGKTIQIFLASGTPDGLREVQIKGRAERIYVVLRSQLGALADWELVSKTGIYVLFGDDPDGKYSEYVYIGQSDNVRNRLLQHDKNPENEFWRLTLLLTSTDDNLHGAIAKYLESRLIEVARNAGRARLKNDQYPPIPRLSKSDEALAEEILDAFLTLLPVNNFHFATPPIILRVSAETTEISPSLDTHPIFEISRSRIGVSAKAQEVDGKFFILKGSQARAAIQTSLSDSVRNRRSQLIEQGILRQEGDYLIFEDNVEFSSPSAAAQIVTGASVNGRIYWLVNETETTYAEWSTKRNEEALGS